MRTSLFAIDALVDTLYDCRQYLTFANVVFTALVVPTNQMGIESSKYSVNLLKTRQRRCCLLNRFIFRVQYA